MNGINAIRLDINSTRFDVNSTRKRIEPVNESSSATDANKKKQLKTVASEKYNDFNSNQHQAETYSELLLLNKKHFRPDLLSEIYNKMSGVEPRIHPGHFIEYYA